MPNFFNKYPYTDFHELNLDWIIETVKTCATEWAETLTEWHDTEEEWQTLYNYVHDFFDTLDLQEEVDIKINEMISDGTFSTLVTPIIESAVASDVAPAVTEWLNANVDPVGSAVVVDNSLTIAGAAADAKVTGDRFSAISNDISQITGNESLQFTEGYYIAAGNFTPPAPTPVANSAWDYIFMACNPGDVFNIIGIYGYSTSIRGWIFYDSTGTRILNGLYNVSYNDWHSIMAPATAAYVSFNASSSSPHYIIKNDMLLDKVNGNPIFIQGLTWSAGYITNNGATPSAVNYVRSDAFEVKAGQTLYITAEMRVAQGALLSRWTSDGSTFIESLIVGIIGPGVTSTWTAPFDCYVRISVYSSINDTFKITDLTSIEAGEAISYLNDQDNSLLYEWERILNSVCCIGDSLTKGAYYVNGHGGNAISQNYPYFISKQTGLTVDNEGISGSSSSSAWPYLSTLDFTPYNAFIIWYGTNGGLTDTLYDDGVIDSDGNLIPAYNTYANTDTGCYCKIIGEILNQVPHAKIFLGSIYTAGGGVVATTNLVIGKIAELYPGNVMGVIDMNDGTLYDKASKHMTPSWVHIDNITHFSMVGNYYMAVHWIKNIRKIIAEDPGAFEDIMEDILA